jgi:hypothetical protein
MSNNNTNLLIEYIPIHIVNIIDSYKRKPYCGHIYRSSWKHSKSTKTLIEPPGYIHKCYTCYRKNVMHR